MKIQHYNTRNRKTKCDEWITFFPKELEKSTGMAKKMMSKNLKVSPSRLGSQESGHQSLSCCLEININYLDISAYLLHWKTMATHSWLLMSATSFFLPHIFASAFCIDENHWLQPTCKQPFGKTDLKEHLYIHSCNPSTTALTRW